MRICAMQMLTKHTDCCSAAQRGCRKILTCKPNCPRHCPQSRFFRRESVREGITRRSAGYCSVPKAWILPILCTSANNLYCTSTFRLVSRVNLFMRFCTQTLASAGSTIASRWQVFVILCQKPYNSACLWRETPPPGCPVPAVRTLERASPQHAQRQPLQHPVALQVILHLVFVHWTVQFNHQKGHHFTATGLALTVYFVADARFH